MISVVPQPEPADFDAKVRQPGNAWLAGRGIAMYAPLPKGTDPHPYWRECLDELHRSHGGICAYLAVYIERATGAASVDHFVAKSALAGNTYEWSNYRLACLAMNARKRAFDDVLDPFALPPDVFHLELVTGRIYVNPGLTKNQLGIDAQATIDRLKLDSGVNREMRARHFDEYLMQDCSAGLLARYSPFVWAELQRQGAI
ncbi:MAG: hypothetical protein HYZ17_04200 [Betaproteobacteria bacterium]|nr:hypothetical protein [Betaproteobacteria bacterium]